MQSGVNNSAPRGLFIDADETLYKGHFHTDFSAHLQSLTPQQLWQSFGTDNIEGLLSAVNKKYHDPSSLNAQEQAFVRYSQLWFNHWIQNPHHAFKNPEEMKRLMRQALDNGHVVALTSFTRFEFMLPHMLNQMGLEERYVSQIPTVGGFPRRNESNQGYLYDNANLLDNTYATGFGKNMHADEACRRIRVQVPCENRMLIDDKYENCKMMVQGSIDMPGGGKAVLVPTPRNNIKSYDYFQFPTQFFATPLRVQHAVSQSFPQQAPTNPYEPLMDRIQGLRSEFYDLDEFIQRHPDHQSYQQVFSEVFSKYKQINQLILEEGPPSDDPAAQPFLSIQSDIQNLFNQRLSGRFDELKRSVQSLTTQASRGLIEYQENPTQENRQRLMAINQKFNALQSDFAGVCPQDHPLQRSFQNDVVREYQTFSANMERVMMQRPVPQPPVRGQNQFQGFGQTLQVFTQSPKAPGPENIQGFLREHLLNSKHDRSTLEVEIRNYLESNDMQIYDAISVAKAMVDIKDKIDTILPKLSGSGSKNPFSTSKEDKGQKVDGLNRILDCIINEVSNNPTQNPLPQAFAKGTQLDSDTQPQVKAMLHKSTEKMLKSHFGDDVVNQAKADVKAFEKSQKASRRSRL